MKQCMDAENLHRRLKKIIGQVQAIDRMIEEDIPCEDVLRGPLREKRRCTRRIAGYSACAAFALAGGEGIIRRRPRTWRRR